MTRFMIPVLCVLTCVLVCVPVSADDPPKKLTPDERKELEAKLEELGTAGVKAYQARKFDEGQKACEEALGLANRLFPKAEYPDGHKDIALAMNNLAAMLKAQEKYADAERLYRDVVEMKKRLLKGDHLDVALSLNNLGMLLLDQGSTWRPNHFSATHWTCGSGCSPSRITPPSHSV